MKILKDLIIINLSAILVFLFREYSPWFVKEPPSVYLGKYLLALIGFNLLYLFVAWLMGLFDKRHKRALLEEFALIFGVFFICVGITIVVLFLSRFWWISRVIVYSFLILAIFLLWVSRILSARNGKAAKEVLKYDLTEFKQAMLEKAANVELHAVKKLTIIIVNTNEIDKTKVCLASLKDCRLAVPLEIIVVDNNSRDGTVDFLQQNYPEVKIIKNDGDLGYARSINKAIAAASGDYFLILNPDTIILPKAIELMLDYYIKHPKVGLVSCKLFNEDGSLQLSVRRFMDLRTYIYRFSPLRGLMAGSAVERYYLMQDWDHNGNRLVDWVMGCCLLTDRRAIEEVGAMDNGIFLYFDDVEWCFRMWDKGRQVAYVGDAGIIHKHIRTSVNKLFHNSSFETIEHLKSLVYFLRKYGLKFPKGCPSSQV